MSRSGTGSRLSGQGEITVTSAAARHAKTDAESFISEVPNWIEVDELPWKERCEI